MKGTISATMPLHKEYGFHVFMLAWPAVLRVALMIGVLIGTAQVPGTTRSWAGDIFWWDGGGVGDSWGTPANWSKSPLSASGADDPVIGELFPGHEFVFNYDGFNGSVIPTTVILGDLTFPHVWTPNRITFKKEGSVLIERGIGGATQSRVNIGPFGIYRQVQSGPVEINAPLVLLEDQEWFNASTSTTSALTISDSLSLNGHALTIHGSGLTDISANLQSFHEGFFGGGSADGSIVKQGFGTLKLTGNNAYASGTTIQSGTVFAGPGSTLGSGDVSLLITGAAAGAPATLLGTPTIQGNVSSSGRIGPGNTPGSDGVGNITINGSYTQLGDGLLAIEMDDNASSGDFDTVTIDGAAELEGTLFIDASDLTMAEASAGEVFQFLTATNISGVFDTVTLFGRDDIFFDISYDIVSPQETIVIATAVLMGDANTNGLIDDDDAMALASAIIDSTQGYNFASGAHASHTTLLSAFNFSAAEMNDTTIDFDDISGFVAAYSQSNGVSMASAYQAFDHAIEGASIPEPSGLLILSALATCGLILLRVRPSSHKLSTTWLSMLVLATTLLCGANSSQASDTFWWDGGGAGHSWGTPANWSKSPLDPTPDPLISEIFPGHEFVFNYDGFNGSVNPTPVILGDQSFPHVWTPDRITFKRTGSVTINQGINGATESQLNIGPFGIERQIQSGPVEINAPIVLLTGQTWFNASTSTTSALTISDRLALNGNSLTIRGSGLTDISANIQDIDPVVFPFGVEGGGVANGVIFKQGFGTLKLTGNNQYDGGTIVRSGTLIAGSVNALGTGDVTLLNNGTAAGAPATLIGTPTIQGNVFNSGRVAPGNSPGIITILGAFTQTATGTLEIEVGSYSGTVGAPDWLPGTDHDQLQISGIATLGGKLEVPVIDPLKSAGGPAIGLPAIDFLTAGSVIGEFSEIVAPGLEEINSNLTVEVDYQAGVASLSFVAKKLNLEFDDVTNDGSPTWQELPSWQDVTDPLNPVLATEFPTILHDLTIENSAGSAQTLQVATAQEQVARLTVGTAGSDGLTLLVGDGAGAAERLTSVTSVNIAENGTLSLDGGTVSGTSVNVNGGLLTGKGTLESDVIVGMSATGIDATLAPGDTAAGATVGALSITGDYTQGTDGVFAIDITGDNSGGNSDLVTVSGAAALDGMIRIDISDLTTGEFTPGDTYDILAAEGALSGGFDSIEVVGGEGIYFVVTYGDTASTAFALAEGASAAPINIVRLAGFDQGDADGVDGVTAVDASIFAAMLIDNGLGSFDLGGNMTATPNFFDVFDFVDTSPSEQRVVDFDDIPKFAAALAANGMSLAQAYSTIDLAIEQARSNASVPEPSGLLLFSLALFFLTDRMRRSHGGTV